MNIESSNLSTSSTHARQAYDEEYGEKLVYLSLDSQKEFKSWGMIDPNYCGNKILFQPVEDMEKLPDLCKPQDCSYVNYESKIYVIGGRFRRRIYSNKVFIYDLINKSWEKSCQLNMPRCSPQVFVAGKVIYVVGGESSYHPSDQTFIEFFDFNSVHQKWKLLSTCNRVPIDLLTSIVNRSFCCSALYERGNQFLIFTYRFGVYAFDYVNKTWKDMPHLNEDEYMCRHSNQVVIVGDILFHARFPAISMYHLKNKAILSSFSLEQNPYHNEIIQYEIPYPTSHLFRVGKDTLLLINHYGSFRAHDSSREIYCCRYRIDYSSEETLGIRLVQDGSQFLPAKGNSVGPSFLVKVKQDMTTMNMADLGKHLEKTTKHGPRTTHMNISPGSTVLQQETTNTIKSLFLVLKFVYGGYRGMMFSFKVNCASGEIMPKHGPTTHIRKFYDRDDYLMRAVRPMECARLCGSSHLYFLFNKGDYGSKPLPPPPEGIIYDTTTQLEIGTFPLPVEKQYGPLISAYGKLYHFSDPCSFPFIPPESFQRFDPSANCWELLPFCPFYCFAWSRLKTIGYAVCSGCIIFSLAYHLHGQWQLILFDIATKEWHKVRNAGSGLDEHLPFEGRAIVLNDIIYTVSKYSIDVVLACKLRIESTLNSTGSSSMYSFCIETLAAIEVDMAPPPLPFQSLPFRYLACIGDKLFCLLTTAQTYTNDDVTYVCATTFGITFGEYGSILLKQLDAKVLEVHHPKNGRNEITLCFTPDYDDTITVENKSWMSRECTKSDVKEEFKYKLKAGEYKYL